MITAFHEVVRRFSSEIERCIASKSLNLCYILHAQLLKTSLNVHTFLANRVIHMYATCGGQLEYVCKVLDEIPHPDLVSYNSLISILGRRGSYTEALGIFRQMQRRWSTGITMDNFTAVGVISACGGLAELRLLRQAHGAMISTGLDLNEAACNSLISNYGRCGDFDTASTIFRNMPVWEETSWTSMLWMYLQNGRLQDATRIFENMPVKSVVSWTMLISGYVLHNYEEDALEFFREMVKGETVPNSFTFVCILDACANLAVIRLGKQLHGHIVRRICTDADHSNLFLSNALIDMYAKCGDMSTALLLFNMTPGKDTISWNSIITGFAHHGYGKDALAIFNTMETSNVAPNHVTFLGVLSACNHAGLVSEGRRYFSLMENKYGIRSRREHYAVLVDLLGRNCMFEEALDLLESMPDGSGTSDIRCWGSLLAACRLHGNVDLAKRVSELLFKLEPENVGRYAMMSNIYASAGKWEESKMTRGLVRDRGLSKEPGCSWIEVQNTRHAFVAKDKSHPRKEEIYQMLFKLVDQMKKP